MRARRSSGFTLIEVMVVFAIIAIAATVALPEFNNLVASRRVASAADDLYATLFLARSEAIRQNQVVVVDSVNGNWSNGWQVANPANPAIFLIKHENKRMAVTATSANISYMPSGRLPSGSMPVFTLCDSDKKAKRRVLSIDLSGLPYITVGDPCS